MKTQGTTYHICSDDPIGLRVALFLSEVCRCFKVWFYEL